MIGVLREIHLFPVKSVPGLSPLLAVLEPDGLAGDRHWAVADAAGEVLVAKRNPRLRQLSLDTSHASPASDPVVSTPDGSGLADFLDVPGARFALVDGGARQVAPVHVVSTAQRRDPDGGDSSRANLVLEFGDGEPAPDAWVGAVCGVGADVVLRLGERPRHCAGLFAQVVAAGTLRVGDEVRLELPT